MFKLTEEEQFLKSQFQAVIATLAPDGTPESSTIFYIYDKPHLYFMTKQGTRKFGNLSRNNDAAITICDNEKPIAANLKGHVVEIEDTDLHDTILRSIVQCAQTAYGDYPPIVKLSLGEFKAMKFTVDHSVYNNFTK